MTLLNSNEYGNNWYYSTLEYTRALLNNQINFGYYLECQTPFWECYLF